MLNVTNVTRVYGEGTTRVVALNNISLEVSNGSFITIMGPSGSGKSTLLNIIGGLERLTRGEILIDGERVDNLDENTMVSVRRNKIAYVFQQYHLLPSLTALENVLLPLVLNGTDHQSERASRFTGGVFIHLGPAFFYMDKSRLLDFTCLAIIIDSFWFGHYHLSSTSISFQRTLIVASNIAAVNKNVL